MLPTEGFRAPDKPSLSGKFLRTKDFQKRDFESECFLNIAAEIVSQFFQPLNSAQHIRCGETFS